MKTPEQLQQQTNQVKSSLDQLRNEAQSAEKTRKAVEIQSQLSSLQSEVEAARAAETDANKKQQIEEVKKLVEATSAEANNLVSNVAPATSTNKAKPAPEEGLGDKIVNNVKAVFSKDAWSKETATNILRSAGIIGAGVAIGAAVKGLWNRVAGDDEEEKKSDSNSDNAKKEEKKEEEKSFRSSGFGKILKWTGIGAGVGTAGYYLGKWFGWWGDKKATDTTSDNGKYKSYIDFIEKNPEAKNNYEDFGQNVDTMYESLYQQELTAGYQDELEMERIAKEQSGGTSQLKGVVPYCLDNKFGTIEEILAQNTSFKNAMGQGLNEMLRYVKSLGSDFLQLFVDSFLSKLPSWSLVSSLSGSLEDKLEKWKVGNQQAELELQYFFRQGIRIQAYLFEKKDQLVDKIASEAAQRYGKSKSEIMGDEKLFDQYILKDPQYQAFVGSSIVNGVNVLRDKATFDAQVGENIKSSVENLDKERKAILNAKEGQKDILQAIAEKKQKNENLTPDEVQLLASSCDGIVKDIDDNIMDAVETSAWNHYGDLLRISDDPNIREYMNNAGLLKIFEEYKVKINEKKAALKEGKLDNEEIYALSDTINNMLALKKEVILGSQTIERDYDENGNILYRIPGFLTDSIQNLRTGAKKLRDGEWASAANYLASAGLGTGVSLVIMGGVVYMFGGKAFGKGAMKVGATIATFPASMLYKGGKLMLSNSLYAKKLGDKIAYKSPKWIQSLTFFRGEKGPDTLMDALKTGKIKLTDAENILARKLYGRWSGKHLDLWKREFEIVHQGDKGSINLAEKIFDKLAGSSKLGNGFLTELKKDPDLYQKVVKYFDEDPRIVNAILSDEPISQIKSYISEIEAKHSISTVDDAVDAAGDALRKKPIFNDLGEQKKLLDAELERLQQLPSKSSVDQARINKLQTQLTELEKFEKQILNGGAEMVDQNSELLTLLKKGGNLSSAIEQLELLKKLEGEKFVSSVIDPKTGKGIERSLDEVIKNLDDAAIRSLKGKISGISDDAIENLAKTLADIKVAQNAKKLFNNADELLTGVKMLIKIFAKTT